MDLRITQTVQSFGYLLKKSSLVGRKRETLAGSLSEGSFSASFFNENYIDVDLGIKGSGHINKRHQHWIRNIKNKTGFLNIKIEKGTEVIYYKEFVAKYIANIDYR